MGAGLKHGGGGYRAAFSKGSKLEGSRKWGTSPAVYTILRHTGIKVVSISSNLLLVKCERIKKLNSFWNSFFRICVSFSLSF
jgi:hypothetical protein